MAAEGVARTVATQVLVVGGGPVGLTLAVELAARGIDTVVAERRCPPASRPASSATTSRRAPWRSSAASGVARRLRDAGLPADYPNDVVLPHHRHRAAS